MDPVTIVVPVLGRPQNAAPFMASLRASITCGDRPDVIVVVNYQTDVETEDAWIAAGASVLHCAVEPGSFGQKANLAAGFIDNGWMFLCGDDVAFHPGWLEAALTDVPDEVCVIGVSEIPDDAVLDRGRIGPAYEATLRSAEHTNHMFFRMSYIREKGASWDGPGTVAGPYRHWFTNNEMSTKARQDGVWLARPESVVEHLHPYFGKGEMDATYELGEKHAAKDSLLWNQRLNKYAPELLWPIVDLTGN